MIIRELFAKLGIQLDRRSANQANRFLGRMRGRLDQAASSGDRLGHSIRRGVAALLGFGAVLRGGSGLQRTIVATERLRQVMLAMEGSAEAASRSFDFVIDFATQTPFNVDQVTEAFLRLRGAGIEPTVELLSETGDFAATFGSDLNTIVEASQNAARGMPRLLESIIRADIDLMSRPGVALVNFRGELFEIERSTDAMLDFVRRLGREQFGGAMANQMATIIGATSNLGDAWTAFQRRIGDAGVTGALTRFYQEIIRTLNGSEDLADAIGRRLTRAIDGLREALIWLREHADEVRRALVLIGSVTVTRAIIGATAALARGLRRALGPLNLLLAGLAMIPLVIDDVIAFMEGRPSVLEMLLGKDATGRTRQTMTQTMLPMLEELGSAMGELFEQLGRLGANLLEILGRAFPDIVGVTNVGEGIGAFFAAGMASLTVIVDLLTSLLDVVNRAAEFIMPDEALTPQLTPEEQRRIRIHGLPEATRGMSSTRDLLAVIRADTERLEGLAQHFANSMFRGGPFGTLGALSNVRFDRLEVNLNGVEPGSPPARIGQAVRTGLEGARNFWDGLVREAVRSSRKAT